MGTTIATSVAERSGGKAPCVLPARRYLESNTVSDESVKDPQRFPNSLRWAMWKRHMSNADLGRACQGKVHHSVIARVVHGQTVPSLETARLLAEALGMSIDEAFYTRQRMHE